MISFASSAARKACADPRILACSAAGLARQLFNTRRIRGMACNVSACRATHQREVLRLMAGGQLNKQIAYELSLSERTIKMHRAAVLRTLGFENTADAIRLAVEAGL